MSSRLSFARSALCLFASVSLLACSCEPNKTGGDSGTDSGAVADAGDGSVLGDAAPDATPPEAGPTGDVCGDSMRGITEACDDGNFVGGDGCSANCRLIEPNFRCPTVGMLCLPIECGDRVITPPEMCDDDNGAGGDGCSSTCQVEMGWVCPLVGVPCRAAECGDGLVRGTESCDDGDTPPAGADGCDASCQLEPLFHCPTPNQACVPSTCGNGILEGLEQCEDCKGTPGDPQGFIRGGETCGAGSTHGTAPYDGCDPTCVLEPSCAGGTCTAVCGDGVILPGSGEACDDGNVRSFDGCSSTCVVETGYMCTPVPVPAPSEIVLPTILRDFRGLDLNPGHLDFQLTPSGGFLQGIAQTTLDAEKKPVRAAVNPGTTATAMNSFPETADTFAQWYRSVGGTVNTTVFGTITLLPSMGTYQFPAPPVTAGPNYFPLDGLGFNVGGASPFNEGTRNGGAPAGQHNFHFTTEAHYWFEYVGNERLRFVGDDDLFVFVDGHLCLDIGGQHSALSGIMNFGNPAEQDAMNGTNQTAIVTACKAHLDARRDALRTATNNATVNPVFEMIVFNAERHTVESNFFLMLTNFVKRRSECHSTCGDGIVASDEVCDVAPNTGGYNGCLACMALGPYCGDSQTTAPDEECDDGVNGSVYGAGGCDPLCQDAPICGDGVRQQAFEQCDDGANNGDANSFCRVNCTLTIQID